MGLIAKSQRTKASSEQESSRGVQKIFANPTTVGEATNVCI